MYLVLAMKLFDFSVYAERRRERKAAEAVQEVLADINQPNAVDHLKTSVIFWFELHREVLKRASNE